eukprot:1151301-Pelagomonas_calceolata.AAC.2
MTLQPVPPHGCSANTPEAEQLTQKGPDRERTQMLEHVRLNLSAAPNHTKSRGTHTKRPERVRLNGND